MTAQVLKLPSATLYTAKSFIVAVERGEFKVSGTLCGHIDVATPEGPTFVLTPDEALALVTAIQTSRADVLANSRPFSDPRIYEER